MSGFINKQTNIQNKLKLLKIIEWLRLHFPKYICTRLLTCMFQLMALNDKHNILLCRLHYIDVDYAIIMILIGPLKWSDIWMSNIQILVICALSV